MKNLKQLLLLFLLINLGCSYTTHFVGEGSQVYPPTTWDDIEIFSGDIDREYTVIAAITSDATGPTAQARLKILQEAASIGADAIIFTKLTKLHSFNQRTGISGVAVKYLD